MTMVATGSFMRARKLFALFAKAGEVPAGALTQGIHHEGHRAS